jgi:hypothetical protein
MENPHQRGFGQARLFVRPRSHAHGSPNARASLGRRVSAAVRWLVILLLVVVASPLGTPGMATAAIGHESDVDSSAKGPPDTSQGSHGDRRLEISVGYDEPRNLSRVGSAREAFTGATKGAPRKPIGPAGNPGAVASQDHHPPRRRTSASSVGG